MAVSVQPEVRLLGDDFVEAAERALSSGQPGQEQRARGLGHQCEINEREREARRYWDFLTPEQEAWALRKMQFPRFGAATSHSPN